ncbi:MAG: hypothetical protein GTO41_14570, partial [Burkholderiales bacterium]|nr:hypothetical protein [Burkholderiales bacterium]
AKLEASDSSPSDNFGRSVALRDDTALIGAFGAGDNGSTRGAAYVFTRDGQGDWTERSKLSSSDGHWGDRFGYAVALQGDTALISAPGANSSPSGPGPGVVYVFTREGAGKWTEVAKLQASDGLEDDEFGYAVALDGDIALIAAPSDDGNGEDSGSAYIFIRNEAGHWLEQAKLLNLDGSAWDHFGRSVALDGTTALISADGDDDIGSVHVFDYNSAGQWTERDKILASDGAAGDVFGASIATTDRAAVIGAYGDEYNGWGSGAAYVYTQDGEGKWTEKAKLLASDRASDDQFGNSIAIDGNTIIVGAFANDDDGTNSGSAYVFSLATTKYVWTMVG